MEQQCTLLNHCSQFTVKGLVTSLLGKLCLHIIFEKSSNYLSFSAQLTSADLLSCWQVKEFTVFKSSRVPKNIPFGKNMRYFHSVHAPISHPSKINFTLFSHLILDIQRNSFAQDIGHYELGLVFFLTLSLTLFLFMASACETKWLKPMYHDFTLN
jgi:hypothetical protein